MWSYEDIESGMSINYSLVETPVDPKCGVSTVYGINAEMYVYSKPACRASIQDAFCTRSEAEAFIVLLAENGVDPCQLSDVLYDYLSR